MSGPEKKETRGQRAAHVGAVAAGPIGWFPAHGSGKHQVADPPAERGR